jgi:hypothetical protein
MGLSTMAIRAANLAFVDFFLEPFQAHSVLHQVGDVARFNATNVVKFEYYRIRLSAVFARVLQQPRIDVIGIALAIRSLAQHGSRLVNIRVLAVMPLVVFWR